MSRIDVAFAVDRGNLDHLAVVARSILSSADPSTDVRFHILYDGPGQEAEALVKAWGLTTTPNVLGISNPYAGSKPGGHLTSAAYLRLQLPETLNDLDRVIYLDADIIVHRDLSALYEADLGGAAAGGVLDMVFYSRLGREVAEGRSTLADYLVSLGLDPSTPEYVNSGVLVLDLKQLREMDFSNAALAAFESRHFEYGDQCMINCVLAGRMALLDPRWNATAQNHAHPSRWRFLPPALKRDALAQRASYWVTHYTGPRKPWSSATDWRGGAWWATALGTGHRWPEPTRALSSVEQRRATRLRRVGQLLAALWTIGSGRRREV